MSPHCLVLVNIRFSTGNTLLSVNIIEFKYGVTGRKMLETKSNIPNYFFESNFIYKIMQLFIFLRFNLKEWVFRKTLRACWIPKVSYLVCMSINLNPLIKMSPEMSKIAISICFVPVTWSHKTQALEFNNKSRYHSFFSKQILNYTTHRRKDIST